ncbi:MAG TPA: TIGR03089 family protein [Mycobacteriales bacterium]|nr:TIGR03089 family protein [Mycobacteriales bacterium]
MRRLSTAGALPGPRDPAQPLLTMLADGGRVELSGATAANWRAKTANLLHAAGAPDRVGLLLPLHWQAVTLLLGAVAAGATVVVAREPAELEGCAVAFVTAGTAAAALDACDGDVLAVSTAPLGGRLRDLPAMVLDAGAELPSYGDTLSVPAAAGWSVELAGAAMGPLPDLGLGPADRVLTTLPPASADGLLLGLLGPLAAGAALVLVPGALDLAALDAERVTAAVGADVPGVRRLDS